MLEMIFRNVRNLATLRFWDFEYVSYNQRYREDAAGPILNKVGQFLAQPTIRALITQKSPKLDCKKAIEGGYVVVVNLAKHLAGEEPANLLGSLFISHLYQSLLEVRNPVHLYVDEFQSLGTYVLATMLSEGRKYGRHLTLAHQFLNQIPDAIRSSILGNVGRSHSSAAW
jgi:tRNA isopentenyl-2-thiomethyl-A-37 hydroxylase MiaE